MFNELDTEPAGVARTNGKVPSAPRRLYTPRHSIRDGELDSDLVSTMQCSLGKTPWCAMVDGELTFFYRSLVELKSRSVSAVTSDGAMVGTLFMGTDDSIKSLEDADRWLHGKSFVALPTANDIPLVKGRAVSLALLGTWTDLECHAERLGLTGIRVDD